METAEQIKEKYFLEVKELLRPHSEELNAFEALWVSGKLREAYVFALETVKNLSLVLSQENKKTDEDFFWTYMH